MQDLLSRAPQFLFFTGKGGVGKTSMACASALGLAEQGRRVLLISTDPASNLDEVLETQLSSIPVPVNGATGLLALNINPIQAASEYRERMVGPYRGVLPDAAITQMEEQLSGACTVEIAGFNEFSKMIGNEEVVRDYDHIVLDTAPTGHTLRLLNLPSAWNDFIATNQTGSSCLGPIAGLKDQKNLYEQVLSALKDPRKTLLILVARAESMSFLEAERASGELRELGLGNQHLIVNGLFSTSSDDGIARSLAEKSRQALSTIPSGIAALPTTSVRFRSAGVKGLQSLRDVYHNRPDSIDLALADRLQARKEEALSEVSDWSEFLDGLEADGRGVIMTMGKGGVGKTTMAAMIAAELTARGHSVVLSTTDPAAHIAETIGAGLPNLKVERIDPKVETSRYVASVLENNRNKLSPGDMALLEEEMRSPCIEEIAVFQAFARTVAHGDRQFVVLDTAPTGHTLLLLDATQSYHREVAKSVDDLPDEVKRLLPRIRDPQFTKVVLVTLAEATPTHEASGLQDDLRRAGIEPHGWIVNRCFAVTDTEDPALRAKSMDELLYIEEILARHARRIVVSPWVAEELRGIESFRHLRK